MNRRLLNVKEVSELTGLSTNTVYAWVSQDRIPYVKLGRLVKFDSEELDRWIGSKAVKESHFDDLSF